MRSLCIVTVCAMLKSSIALVVPLSAARPAASLQGVSLSRISDGTNVDLGQALASTAQRTLLILGTHAADFNSIEYAQRLRFFLPQMQEKGIERFIFVINGNEASCRKLTEMLDLPEAVEVLADPVGEAGRKFGVSRGFAPDEDLSPFVKLFVVGIGLGPPWGTLPAVLTGYLGNPGGRRDWIEAALQQGQLAGRWPFVLDLADDGSMIANRFDNFPLLGGWGRRPFELATLRLQNLVSIQFAHYAALKPTDDRCLTQLGGLCVVGPGGDADFVWCDAGLCDLPDMRELIDAL